MGDFNIWKERGNRLFNNANSNQNLAVCVYQMRMSQAIQHYNKALQFASNDKDRASIWKNLAVTQFRIGKRLSHTLVLSKKARKQKVEDVITSVTFFLKERLTNFGLAMKEGSQHHGEKWADHLLERRSECIEFFGLV